MLTHSLPRQAASFLVVFSFLVVLLVLGVNNDPVAFLSPLAPDKSSQFSQYRMKGTVSENDLQLDKPGRRVMFVGDIHGMKDSFDALLAKLQYDSTRDYLIHVGDITAKGPVAGSLAVLAHMAAHNITGVRGNHDQRVVEWRGWIERVLAHDGGPEWLADIERMSPKDAQKYLKKRKGKNWQRVPKKWKILADHYQIARAMTPDQYTYLLNLPLTLHVPTLHSFVVHAGMLPLDPKRPALARKQPLAHAPRPAASGDRDTEARRAVQENAILKDVPPNRDPWTLINMRSVLRRGDVSRENDEGSPWSELWSDVLDRCHGFDGRLRLDGHKDDEDSNVDDYDNLSDLKHSKLPCHPATVIYGHAASRGLDVKRWSKGLDSGCVYGRKLTAMVVTHDDVYGSATDVEDLTLSHSGSVDDDDEHEDLKPKHIKYGESMRAELVQVKCHLPEA